MSIIYFIDTSKMTPYWLVFCILLFVCGAHVQANPRSSDYDLEKGYYWREYTRDVPRDAFPGGIDSRGKPIYIGQTFYTGCQTPLVLPGQIIEAAQKITYEWGFEEHETKTNIQILCTRNPELFEWVKTNATDINKLKGLHLVSGGIEKDYTVYIGRVSTEGQVAVGRVLVTDNINFQGLYTTMNGKYLHVFSSFDVLTYKSGQNPVTQKLKSPNSSPINAVWQPLFGLIILRMFYCS